MAWSKFDDGFHSHPKVVQVGNAGAGLYAKAITYCSHYLTDGFVPEDWVRGQLGKGERNLPARMVEARLWERIEGGWYVPDYLDFNPPRTKVLERRQKDLVRKGIPAESSRNPTGLPKDSIRPVPVPVPTPQRARDVA